MQIRHLGLTVLMLAAAGAAAAATEYGTVISSTPVMGQVNVPERRCHDEEVSTASRPRSGAGAVVGAVIGGVIGNQIGHGAGRAAATGVGAVLGAAVGDHAEADAAAAERSVVQRCRTTRRVEDRLLGYDVVYEHNGVQRSARLPQDPGAPGTPIAVEVNIAPAAAAGRPARAGMPVPSRRSTVIEDEYIDDEYTVQTRRQPYPYYAPAPVVVAPVVYPAPVIWVGGHWGHHRRGYYGR